MTDLEEIPEDCAEDVTTRLRSIAVLVNYILAAESRSEAFNEVVELYRPSRAPAHYWHNYYTDLFLGRFNFYDKNVQDALGTPVRSEDRQRLAFRDCLEDLLQHGFKPV